MSSVGPFRKILDWSLLRSISSSEEKTEDFTTKKKEVGLLKTIDSHIPKSTASNPFIPFAYRILM